MKMDIKSIYNDANYWFIAFCVTPWHVMGVKAFVQKHFDERREINNLNGAIVILKHPKTGYCIDDSFVRSLNIPTLTTVIKGDVDYNLLSVSVLFSCIKKFFRYRQSRLSKRFVLSTLEPFVFCELNNYSCIKNQLVLIDEGVSSYTSTIEYIKHSYIESNNLSYVLRLPVRLFTMIILKHIFSVHVSKWLLFDKSSGYSINKDVAGYYLKQYTNVKDSIDIGFNYIIYLSQPSVTDIEKEIVPQLLNSIANICRRKGILLYVKMHPRDNVDMFDSIKGVCILKQSDSIENLYPALHDRPLCVIGNRSTALLTLKAFYDANCVSIIKLLKNEYNKKLNSDDKFFCRCFSGHVSFIENYCELDDYIQNNCPII